MAFNVKTRRARAIWHTLLQKPADMRHGITGFWVASLPRVREERLVRVAYLPDRQFVFEADIDPAETHVMTSSRIEEYVEHELLKYAHASQVPPIEEIRALVRRSTDQGRRIVVAFRNARSYTADTHHLGTNPVWYTDD